MSATAVEQATTAGCVQIRTSRHRWVGDLVMSGFCFPNAAHLWVRPPQFWPGS